MEQQNTKETKINEIAKTMEKTKKITIEIEELGSISGLCDAANLPEHNKLYLVDDGIATFLIWKNIDDCTQFCPLPVDIIKKHEVEKAEDDIASGLYPMFEDLAATLISTIKDACASKPTVTIEPNVEKTTQGISEDALLKIVAVVQEPGLIKEIQ